MGKIYKGLAFNGEISVALLDTTDVVERAIEYHKLSAVAAAALGRTLTVGAFMSTSLKNEGDSLTITLSGDGAGGHIVVSADSDYSVRGYADNPAVELPLNSRGKLDVAGFVGKGRITVVKSMGLKEPYSGSCRIVSGEIAEDFAAYYTYSEQQPTAISLGVKVGRDYRCAAAGGLVLQPMPNASEESISAAEELVTHFSSISSMIEEMGVNGIIDGFFKGVEFTEYDTEYKCSCSRERIDRVLLTLGEKELYSAVEEQGRIEVECHFCPKKYVYDKKDVDKLLGK